MTKIINNGKLFGVSMQVWDDGWSEDFSNDFIASPFEGAWDEANGAWVVEDMVSFCDYLNDWMYNRGDFAYDGDRVSPGDKFFEVDLISDPDKVAYDGVEYTKCIICDDDGRHVDTAIMAHDIADINHDGDVIVDTDELPTSKEEAQDLLLNFGNGMPGVRIITLI